LRADRSQAIYVASGPLGPVKRTPDHRDNDPGSDARLLWGGIVAA
jgi:hypothetical protein